MYLVCMLHAGCCILAVDLNGAKQAQHICPHHVCIHSMQVLKISMYNYMIIGLRSSTSSLLHVHGLSYPWMFVSCGLLNFVDVFLFSFCGIKISITGAAFCFYVISFRPKQGVNCEFSPGIRVHVYAVAREVKLLCQIPRV